MIRTWFMLSVLGGVLQLLLGCRCRKQWVCLMIPALFSIFAIYACVVLSRIGVDFPVLFCFWLSPVFQLLLFELTFWKKKADNGKNKEVL